MKHLSVEQKKLLQAIDDYNKLSSQFANKKSKISDRLKFWILLPWFLISWILGSYYLSIIWPAHVFNFSNWVYITLIFEFGLLMIVIPAYIVIGLLLQINHKLKYTFYRLLTPKRANRLYAITRLNDFQTYPELEELHIALIEKKKNIEKLEQQEKNFFEQTFEFIDTCSDVAMKAWLQENVKLIYDCSTRSSNRVKLLGGIEQVM
jgi:CBS domain containing-hemolysin-like protein